MALDRPVTLAHQASAIAISLFHLQRSEPGDDTRVVELMRVFRQRLEEAGLGNILERQLKYASTLAVSPGRLSYEELSKLLSLCDEIHAMKSLGFYANKDMVDQFESAVRQRFVLQLADARLAAQDRVDDLSAHKWWYSMLIRNSSEK